MTRHADRVLFGYGTTVEKVFDAFPGHFGSHSTGCRGAVCFACVDEGTEACAPPAVRSDHHPRCSGCTSGRDGGARTLRIIHRSGRFPSRSGLLTSMMLGISSAR
jgi:hypothetical protein